MTHNLTPADLEFDRQLQTLVKHGYPALAGRTEAQFRELVEPLRTTVRVREPKMQPPTEGRVPFLLVVTRALAPLEAVLPLLTLDGKTKPGVIDRHYKPGELERFVSQIDEPAPVYVLFDADRGEEFCNAVPEEALAGIARRDRTPLTIEEGLAFVLQRPKALAPNKCFSLGGTRLGDRRVPAVWRSQNAPKLGWCWAGNPHTWLGVASAHSRAAG